RSLERRAHGVECGEGRAHDHRTGRARAEQRNELVRQGGALCAGLVHLPVPGDDARPARDRAHAAGASSRIATPGSTLPSRNSSAAPPPVERCVKRPASPACCTAATESPPPTTVTAPRAPASAIARATPRVPAA